jgi:hypothetical protein
MPPRADLDSAARAELGWSLAHPGLVEEFRHRSYRNDERINTTPPSVIWQGLGSLNRCTQRAGHLWTGRISCSTRLRGLW